MSLIGIGDIKKATKKILNSQRISRPDIKSTEQDEETETAALISETFQDQEDEGQLSVDVYQTENSIVVIAPVAGVKLEDLHVSVTDDVVCIQGKRNKVTTISDEKYLTQECFWGEFSRSIVLPQTTDKAKIKASFKDGVLKVIVPKTEDLRTKVVRIQG